MNNSIVDEIKTELENYLIPVIKSLIENSSNFTIEYLEREYQKIASAREKDYPTYRSEYRVIKTLTRQRNNLSITKIASRIINVILLQFLNC